MARQGELGCIVMASLIETPATNPHKLHMKRTGLLGFARVTDLLPRPKASQRQIENAPKNRETKDEPTMLLIIKDRFWEPTMYMINKVVSGTGHDVDDGQGFIEPWSHQPGRHEHEKTMAKQASAGAVLRAGITDGNRQ